MRSSWLARLFRHAHGTGHALPLSMVSPIGFSARGDGKGESVRALREMRLGTSPRICLGIGDGVVHRQ